MENIWSWIKQQTTVPVALISIGLSVALCIGAFFSLYMLTPTPSAEEPTAIIAVIPASTATPILPTATSFVIPTSTSSLPPSPLPGMIGIGAYVQIFGTDGDGLRFRDRPGLDSVVQFLAFDQEVFVVQDGPVDVDGILWWYLASPLDDTRNGWAAANYLSVVPAP